MKKMENRNKKRKKRGNEGNKKRAIQTRNLVTAATAGARPGARPASGLRGGRPQPWNYTLSDTPSSPLSRQARRRTCAPVLHRASACCKGFASFSSSFSSASSSSSLFQEVFAFFHICSSGYSFTRHVLLRRRDRGRSRRTGLPAELQDTE